jgi:hypothetical protein
MPQLHAHGVELVLNLVDAADNVESLTQEEISDLLREAANVLSELLKRDLPDSSKSSWDAI